MAASKSLDRSGQWVLAAVVVSVVLIPINSTMIAVGLVPIAHGLHTPVTRVVWAVTSYLVIMAALQPISGKFGDLYGRRRVLLLGLAIFLVSSVLAAVTPHLWALLSFRSGQAVGGALIVPNAMGVVRRHFLRDDLRRALGIVGLTQGLGAASGPLIGAALLAWGGWTAIFWVNVPVVALALWTVRTKVPQDQPGAPSRVDGLGALALAGFLALLALSLPRSGDFHRWIETLPACVLLMGLFVVVERRAANPIVRFQFFRRRPFASANGAILLSNFFMYATLLYMPIYLKNHGYTATATGILLFLFSFAMSLTSWGGSYAGRKLGGQRVVALAFVLDLLVVGWYIDLVHHSGLWLVIIGLILAGLGAGVGTVTMQATALESVDIEIAGVSAGIYSTFRYLGSITASALISLMLFSPAVHSIVLGGIALLGLMVSWGFPRRPHQSGA
ncbi:MAG: MFS transporter [Sulfobacillus acidophilus]|uniref:MFS transporter n=1 Tax=Sulfobacillus acidophilus TaxID=53633 RepID=A0A2T2WN48_9FIRM|nr:MAG: MFS transporter [Sulfobacillus acidophilus]